MPKMLHVVYTRNHPLGPKQFNFCGVFMEEATAKDYFAGLPAEYGCSIQSFPNFTGYPIYLLEHDFKKAPAHPVSLEDLAKEMAMIPKTKNDDHVYFNYYRFVEDYRGIVPGQRYFTITDHYHVAYLGSGSYNSVSIPEDHIPNAWTYYQVVTI